MTDDEVRIPKADTASDKLRDTSNPVWRIVSEFIRKHPEAGILVVCAALYPIFRNVFDDDSRFAYFVYYILLLMAVPSAFSFLRWLTAVPDGALRWVRSVFLCCSAVAAIVVMFAATAALVVALLGYENPSLAGKAIAEISVNILGLEETKPVVPPSETFVAQESAGSPAIVVSDETADSKTLTSSNTNYQECIKRGYEAQDADAIVDCVDLL